MRRGDIVTVALQGAPGKPRPALVVQADEFAAHPSVVLLPITSALVDAPRLRPQVEPSDTNGLETVSQIMVDKIQSVARDKVGTRIGAIEPDLMILVERALATLLRLV